MSHTSFYSLLIGLVPCLIPPYAFRLTRVFGTHRVGWILFSSFSLLAVLQVLRSWWPGGFGIEPALTVDLLNLIVPVLLLIGMVHIETVFKERLKLEKEERRLREGLEQNIKERTAELNQANEELQREISLRKQGEAELKKSKEHYRFLFDENPQPMWIYDRVSLRFLAFNAAAVRFYGYTSNEFKMLTAKQLFSPAETEAFAAESARALSPFQPRVVRRQMMKDGSTIEVDMAGLDLNYAECAARLVLANDVTAQRQLQKQLLQNQKMAVTTQLAGGVVDNFSKLIVSLESDADSALQKCSEPTITQALRRIAATAGSLDALNAQLMALVRRHPMRAQAIDLNQLLENQALNFPRLLGKHITLEKMLWTGLPPIPADPSLVEQIVHHLVLNARDAMPNGGSLTLCTAAVVVDQVRARGHEDARAGSFVCLTVGDTGCGMTAETEARLFDPFFTTKDSAKSTGLGLATVHGLVKQHAGWIEVVTKPGEGSRFSVFFPCLHSARRETEHTVKAALC